MAQKFATRTMNEKSEQRTRNIAAQKKYPASFFSQKQFTGEICSQENQKDSCVGEKEMRIEMILPLYFFTLLFSQKKKKKDTLMGP